MTIKEIMDYLESHGSEQIRRIYANHGVLKDLFGVKVSDLKVIQKRVKKDYPLSLELYETGNYDAMYLAGLIADEERMTKSDLQNWMVHARFQPIASNTVAWIAAESHYGEELAREWIQNKDEIIAAGGWATWTSLVSLIPNEALNLLEIESFLEHIKERIHREPGQVKYNMNYFVIAVGGYIPELREKAKAIGDLIGVVSVDMGNTACKVAQIRPYIEKMEGRKVKKKKQARC